MKSTAVEGYEAEDIRRQIRKILRGLGSPEPPLRLEDVRELLRLDRRFYTSTNTGAFREFVSRMRVAGKQLLHRPTLLLDVIKMADLKALYLPDKKRILIDASKPSLKHRWSESHEIAHSIIPWHAETSFGDTDFTLKPACHEILEAEANYGAGQLLFLQERFLTDARDCCRSIDSVKRLAERYGNTVTSTLWRFVEEAYPDLPLVGIISQHPKHPDNEFDPHHPCRYCVQSPTFRQRFARVTEVQLFWVIGAYCGYQRGGPLGQTEVRLQDDSGTAHLFHFESFCNRYDVLTLGAHLKECPLLVSV